MPGSARSILKRHTRSRQWLELALRVAAVADCECTVVTLLAELHAAVAALALAFEQLQAHEATGQRSLGSGAAVRDAGPDRAVGAELDLAREVDRRGEGKRRERLALGLEADQCVGVRSGDPDVPRIRMDRERIGELRADRSCR